MFRKLLTLEETREVIERRFKLKKTGSESVRLSSAVDRVLAHDILAANDVPGFDRSTVDGYAVRAADTYRASEREPILLRVCGSAEIGKKPSASVKPGSAVEIVTGAPIPRGADGVVMIEYTQPRDDCIAVLRSAGKGENVMKAGSDLKEGQVALRAGTVLGSGEIGVLAACGIGSVNVRKKVRVGVFSTGDELVEPGRKLPFGKVWDINAYALFASVQECGGAPVFLGVFPDKREIIVEAVSQATRSCDVLVSSGGVSVGPKDFMPETLNALGELVVCGITIKPGKPTTIAVLNGTPFFALPGHPASAFLVFDLLVRPMIVRMNGLAPSENLKVEAVAGARMFAAKGRRTFVMVNLKRAESQRLIAVPFGSGLSGAISTIAKADGYVELGENVQFVDEGEKVSVALFRSGQFGRLFSSLGLGVSLRCMP